MPHGPLTPLGRRLRSVVISLGTHNASGSIVPRARDTGFNRGRNGQVGRRTASSAAAAIAETRVDNSNSIEVGPLEKKYGAVRSEDVKPTAPVRSFETPSPDRRYSRKRVNRWTRVDRISEALKDGGRLDLIPKDTRAIGRSDASHVNIWSPTGHAVHKANAERHRNDPIPVLDNAKELRLSRILASYIQYLTRRQDTAEAAWSQRFDLSIPEQNLLKIEGFTMADIREWARIVRKSDSVALAILLKMRIKSHGASSVPLFLILYVLRRQHISRAALSKMLPLIDDILVHRTSVTTGPGRLNSNGAFLAFVRLIRHARVVWPRASERLAEMLVKFLPKCFSDSKPRSPASLQILTYQVNKAMRLVSLPASNSPFRVREHQERAIVRILQFMAEHVPPIDLNREGYRAVAAVQLGQRKSSRDREWAELKTLSWPPWKSDRTAMDAYITHETHGITKAADTLRRMQAAGYGRQDWEAAASISTGWDTDQTPTAQTRALLPTGISRNMRFSDGGKNAWAARITTTRSAQEAWSCYLAYESDMLSQAQAEGKPAQDQSIDQHVMLAIFKKLHQEDQRLAWRGNDRRRPQRFKGLKQHPGDAIEIEPPPPSLHQHVYISRPIPTLHEFYREIIVRGNRLNDRCLAFVIAHASSLSRGLGYILENTIQRAELRSLLDLDGHFDHSRISQPLLTAFLQLLGRFSRVPLPVALAEYRKQNPLANVYPTVLRGQTTHANHPLMLASELLHRARPSYIPAWTAVLVSLSHESSLLNIWQSQSRCHLQFSSDEENRAVGSMTAYRLFQKTLSMMRELRLDLEATSLTAWCHAAENATIGYWTIAREMISSEAAAHEKPYSAETEQLIGVLHGDLARLKKAFGSMVGDTKPGDKDNSDSRASNTKSSRLLDVPGPALIHSYVRALGWLADYGGLVVAVKWMVGHQHELSETREGYRNGEIIMRRALIALRVFMERSWLKDVDKTPPSTLEKEDDSSMRERSRLRTVQQLERLNTAADEDMIEEARVLVDSVDHWCGWASDEEVQEYCQNERFQRLSK